MEMLMQSLHSLLPLLLAQRVKSWRPSEEIVALAVHSAVEASNSATYWNINCKRGIKARPFTIKISQTPLQRASAILDELKSFSSDLGIARDIANHPLLVSQGGQERPEVMPMGHAIDQHCAPNMALFFKPNLVTVICAKAPSSTPFSPLFSKLWKEVSRFNPRRTPISQYYANPFLKSVERAQELYLIAKQHAQIEREVIPSSSYSIKVKLNTGWLACLVGTLDVGGRPAALVTLNADNPKELLAIRRPSRSSLDQLTPSQKQTAIQKARQLLQKGVLLKAAQAPLESLSKARLKLVDGEYIITQSNGEKKPWRKFLKTKLKFPQHASISTDLQTLLTSNGQGVEENANQSLKKLIVKEDPKILRRAMSYLSTYNSTIQMHNIGREGGGTIQSVVIQDTGAYQFLLKLSGLFPGALRPVVGMPGKFHSPYAPLLWHVRKKIKKQMVTYRATDSKWPVQIQDKRKRTPWDHQTRALKDMIQNYKNHNRGIFLWLAVGLGKTYIVMRYIAWLISEGKLPPFVVYSLPESAVNSVIEEISQFGLPIRLIIPLKSLKGKKLPKNVEITQLCQPEPFKINLITSDNNLRKCENELIKLADESLIIFDEVHKNMNDTKRTSVSLNLASLAHDFIAFTGTPVIDSKTYKLIAWLKMIVPFEVNERNYLVAANSMISRPANTGIKIIRKEVLAKFGNNFKLFEELVPPALGGKNVNPTFNDWKEATHLCYDICDREMVNQIQELLAETKGVMLVAKDKAHQQRLHRLLIESGITKVFVLKGGESIHLTDASVKAKKTPDYQVVIVPIRRAEGYTLTRLKAMVTSVYPSNQATRTQIEGRINRIGQRATELEYIVVHIGILTNLMNHHADAKSLEKALEQMAKKI